MSAYCPAEATRPDYPRRFAALLVSKTIKTPVRIPSGTARAFCINFSDQAKIEKKDFGGIDLNLTKEEYEKLNQKASNNTKSYITLPCAFLIGGLICTLGQGLLNLYTYFGLDEKNAGMMVSVTLIFLTALLTGLSVFNVIAKHAGAGTLVPITGFANAMVSPALEFKSEGFILGLGAKMFIIAGPVLVYGISASIIYGIILYLIQVFTG